MGFPTLKKQLLILLMFTCWQSSVAQKIYYVGIPCSKFNNVKAKQEKPQWCWAASIQMVFNYYNIAINQQQIVERTYGRNYHGKLPNWAAGIETMHENLNNLSVDNNGRNYIVQAQFGAGAPEPFFLLEELRHKRPVIIGYEADFGGHAVVITAASYYESAMGPVIRTIVVSDPLTANCSFTNGRKEYNGTDLARRIVGHWFVRVFDVKDF